MSAQDRKPGSAGSSLPLWLGLGAAIALLGTTLLGSHLPATAMAPAVVSEAAPAASPAATSAVTTTAVATTTTAVATVVTATPVAAPAAATPAATAVATPAPAPAPAATVVATTAAAAPAPVAAAATPAATAPAPAPAADATKVAQATTPAAAAPKPDVDVAELMKPGTLPENVLGDAKAPITIVEYASMTCPHCADFHKRIFADLKAKYIDTGKVRFIFREYPLDNLAAAVSELARCTGPMRYFAFVSTMYEHQAEWHTGDNDLPKLQEMAKQAGFTDESFKKCVGDQTLLTGITEVRTRANDKFGVDSTPTFFINGVKLKGSHEMKDFDDVITPMMKG